MAHPEPEITSPVARGRVASIGVTQNFGTSKGGSGAPSIGIVNNASIGGAVDNGQQTTQQLPVSPAALISNPLEGANSKTSTTSVNPESIQDVSMATADNSEKHVSSTGGNQSSPASGYHGTIPRSQTAVELPSSREGVRAQSATMAADVTIKLKGIETSRTYGSVEDLERIANDEGVVKATPNSDRQNGGDGPPRGKGDPTPQERNEELDGEPNNDFITVEAANEASENA